MKGSEKEWPKGQVETEDYCTSQVKGGLSAEHGGQRYLKVKKMW